MVCHYLNNTDYDKGATVKFEAKAINQIFVIIQTHMFL